jgi:hypothetical protein
MLSIDFQGYLTSGVKVHMLNSVSPTKIEGVHDALLPTARDHLDIQSGSPLRVPTSSPLEKQTNIGIVPWELSFENDPSRLMPTQDLGTHEVRLDDRTRSEP